MAALYFGALRTVAALFIASLLWGAAAAAGGAFCVLEKAPYCWGNWKVLASSSSTLLSGLTTKAAGEYGGKVAFGDVDGDGIDELVLVSDSSMIVYAHDASTTASPTPRPTTPRPTTSRPTACLPSTLYLTFSGRSYLNGRTVAGFDAR
ncbi:Zc3h12a-like ribonuclease NYN domain containing protein [Aureococcus anophagefferens]|nr:Zc3h12a-like ribonuclease NYN domain containing protein [Aureococcus anophagefferens]KAH8073991.1 Zc3h12a-like ribonuclease NYN domain containing protein [Aureococcus anophagefferens]KAH8092799.1 Zc3h12a-like ribonuclease NYN domain containing protein [Aureococcus anophagefferens]